MKLFLASTVVALLGTSAHAATNKSAATQRKERQLAFHESAFSEVVQKHAQEIVAASPEMTSVWGDPSDDVRRKLADAQSMFPADSAERKLRGSKSGSKSGGSGAGEGDSNCNFIGKQEYMGYTNGYLQIYNGEITAWKTNGEDDDYVTMCDNTKCVGNTYYSLGFVATGACSGGNAELQLAAYTIEHFDGTPTSGDGDLLYLACPHISQTASIDCDAYDESLDDTTKTIDVEIIGPSAYVDFDMGSSEGPYLFACTMTCTGQDISLFD